MKLFVNYSDFRIDVEHPGIALLLIMLLVLLLAVATKQRSDKAFFDIKTTQSVRGMAVIALLLGHFSSKCLATGTVLDSAGYWAVMTFLFVSGHGLYRRYGLSNLPASFWSRRLIRLYSGLWITLALFVILDYFLIDLRHPWYEIVFNFLGGHFTGALVRINSSAWFVQYILVLYVLYFATSKVPLSEATKVALVFAAAIALHLAVRFTPIRQYYFIWLQYTLVFPLGVLFGFWRSRNPRAIEWLMEKKVLAALVFVACLPVFYYWRALTGDVLSDNVTGPLPFLVALVVMLTLYSQLKWHSGLLMFLGAYSYEIYLIHVPFMVKYDFFLFREPVVLSFFLYSVFVVGLAVLLQRTSAVLLEKMLSGRLPGQPG